MAQLADRLEDELRGYDTPDLRDGPRFLSRMEELIGEVGDRIERRIDASEERVEASLGSNVGRLEGVLRSAVDSFSKAVHPFASGEEGAELGIQGEKRERIFGGRVKDAERRLDSVLQRIVSVEEKLDRL